MGLLGVGGLINRGKIHKTSTFGCDIDFDPGTMRGNVTVMRNNDIDWGSSFLGPYAVLVTALVDAVRDEIKAEIKYNAKTIANGRITKFDSEFDLERLLSNKAMMKIVADLSGKFPKPAIKLEEKYYVLGHFNDITSTGKLDNGVEYYIAGMSDDIYTRTPVAINKGKWTFMVNHLGFQPKAAFIVFDYLYKTFGADAFINTPDKFYPLLDRISNSPALNTVPDLANYLTDFVILVDLYNIIGNNLRYTDWFVERQYSLILKNISDANLANMMKIFTNEWNHGYLVINASPKTTFKMLPFQSQSCPHMVAPHNRYPALQIATLDYKDKHSDGNLDFIRPKYINAMADGSVRINHIVYNRVLGYLGSLTDDLSSLSIDLMEPFVMARERPDMDEESLERRHWSIVWLVSPMLKAPISTENLTEAWCYGLMPYSGNSYWLMTSEPFVRNPAVVYTYKKFTGKSDENGNKIYEDKIITIKKSLFAKEEVDSEDKLSDLVKMFWGGVA